MACSHVLVDACYDLSAKRGWHSLSVNEDDGRSGRRVERVNMWKSKRHDKMLKAHRDREEVDERVENGEMTEEEALEINLKATLKSFERLIDEFEAADPRFNEDSKTGLPCSGYLMQTEDGKCEGDWRANWRRLKG